MFYWTKVLVATLQVVVIVCLIPGMPSGEEEATGKMDLLALVSPSPLFH